MSNSDHMTPDHLHAIGILIIAWSHFEAQMALGIIALSGMTITAGTVATVDMTAKTLINNIRHLTHLKAPHLADEIDRIIDGDDRNMGLRKLYQVRNLFAHTTFGAGKAKGSIKPLKIRLT